MRGGLRGAITGAIVLASAALAPSCSKSRRAAAVDAPIAHAGGGVADWTTSADLWGRVPLATDCDARQARLPSPLVPERRWSSCGTGCRVMETALPDSPPGTSWTSGAHAAELGGEIYYRISLARLDHAFDEVRRLSDDAPVALFRSRSGARPGGCAALSGFQAPFLFGWFRVGGMTVPSIDLAVASPEVGAPARSPVPPWAFPQAGMRLFTFEGGFGLIDGNALVEAALEPGSSALTVLHTGTAYQLEPVGRGPLLVWVDWDGWSDQNRAHIRSWTRAGGTRILVGGVPEYDVGFVALSDSKIVWIGSTGLHSVQGDFESAALHWSPLTTSPADIRRHVGTGPLPHAKTTTGKLVTSGDLAATTVSWVGDAGVDVHLVVADLVTGKLWEIPSRPGNLFLGVLAMNADTLLLAETVAGLSSREPQRIVRLDLKELDALARGGMGGREVGPRSP